MFVYMIMLTLKVYKTQCLGDRRDLLSGKEVTLWGAEHVLELGQMWQSLNSVNVPNTSLFGTFLL